MKLERNPVGWFEIYVQDMKRAKKFYEKTLQLKLKALKSPIPGLKMQVFPSDQKLPGCSGALAQMDGKDSGGGGALIYFSCADCSVEEARALKAGGTVFREKFSIGDYGFISLILDTEGNMIGLHSLK